MRPKIVSTSMEWAIRAISMKMNEGFLLRKRVTACRILPQLAFSSLTFNHMSLYWEECATYDIWHMMRSYNTRQNVFWTYETFWKIFCFLEMIGGRCESRYATISRPNKFTLWKETIQHNLICNHLLLLQQTFVLPYLRAEHFLECFELLFYWQRFETF